MVILLLHLIFIVLIKECEGRANVTLQLGLSYDGSPDCDDTVYKVTVCVGERIEKCRLFGPFDFYIQAACASHGPKETIEFVVEHVGEPLRINAKVKRTNTDTIYELRSAEAVLTQSREISMASQDLLFVLRFRVSYTCVANYFGDLCDVYCDTQAKEYSCTSLGEKICNTGYVKDPAAGTCVYDRCRSMPDYCLNDGECVNPAQYTDTTAPICICPEGREGPRCEFETTSPPQLPPLKLQVPPMPAASTQSRDRVSGTVDLPELKAKTDDGSASVLSSSSGGDQMVGSSGVSENNGGLSNSVGKGVEPRETRDFTGRLRHGSGLDLQASKNLEEYAVSSGSGHLMADRNLWYQVIVFTSVAVCLTVVAFAACLAASCYVFRFKAKAQLLRQQHNASIGELQFVDSGNIPVYLKRCSSLDCAVNHSSHQNPSVHSFGAINRPLVQASPTLCVEDDPEMIFSNTQSRSPPLMNGQTFPPASSNCQWPPLSLIGSLKRPLKSPHWSDYGNSVPLYERNSRTLQREETPGGAMELSLHAGTADQLPTISPEVYSCRNAYQYLTTPEFNNHLIACPSDSVGASTLNNRLSMRRESSRRRLTLMGRAAGYEVLSQSLGEHPRSPGEPCTELTKNDFRDTCGVDSRGRDGANTAMSTATIGSGIFGREQASNVGMPFEPPSQFADPTLQNSN
ncbi:hypothetical protein SprV_0702362200 [Sparganum proliferum]